MQADTFKKKLLRDKFNANIIFSQHDKLFHVFVFSSGSIHEVHAEARRVKHFTKLRTVKIVSIGYDK
jgi:hypothetical protein